VQVSVNLASVGLKANTLAPLMLAPCGQKFMHDHSHMHFYIHSTSTYIHRQAFKLQNTSTTSQKTMQ
jgi:hypothetical protein